MDGLGYKDYQLNQLLIRVVAGLTLALATPVVQAEDLNSAWREALASDPSLKASQSHIAAAQAELQAANAGRMPTVSASAGISRFEEAPAFDFSAAGVPAVLPLFGGESMTMGDVRVSLPPELFQLHEHYLPRLHLPRSLPVEHQRDHRQS